MDLPNPKKNLNCLLKDLLKGQESAYQLSALVESSDEANGFIRDILHTFAKVISAIETDEAVLKEVASSIESADVKIRSEISNKKRKGFDGSDQRSSSRRRQASTRIIHAKTIEDGQTWRKYGQKDILNSKNPRSYFRCSHKFDQGCKAQRHVQKSEEDPSIFIITYMDNHTCNNSSLLPQIIQNFSSGDNSACLISFESNAAISNNNINDNKPGQDKTVTAPVQSLKQEGEEDMLSNLTVTDLTAGSDSDPMAPTSEQAEDRGDVTSSLNCLIGDLDMHIMWSNFDLIEDWASLCDCINFG